MNPIEAGAVVTIAKGCKARDVVKGTRAVVRSVTPLGAEYGHSVRVVLALRGEYPGCRALSFYARHINRLADTVIGLNDGNPTHRIEIVRRVQP